MCINRLNVLCYNFSVYGYIILTCDELTNLVVVIVW